MQRQASALLVYDQAALFDSLTEALERRSFDLNRVRSYKELSRRFQTSRPSDVVFTDITLQDGTWSDVVRLAAEACVPASVVVVAPVADTNLYIQVMEHGAFDFITPPFAGDGFDYVLHCAVDNALRRSHPGSPAKRLAARSDE